MSQSKEEADRDRTLALLHQLARDVVDRGDVVGIDGVTKPEAIGQHGGSDQNRLPRERDESPDPGRQIGQNQQAVDSGDPASKASQSGIGLACRNYRFRMRSHGGPFIRKTFPMMSPQRKNRPMRPPPTPEGLRVRAGLLACGSWPFSAFPGFVVKAQWHSRRRTHRLQLRAQLWNWSAINNS